MYNIVCKINYIKHITINILLGNFKPFFKFLIVKLIPKPIKDFFLIGFIIARIFIGFIIATLGFIDTLLFFLDIIRFVLNIVIRKFIFVLCFI